MNRLAPTLLLCATAIPAAFGAPLQNAYIAGTGSDGNACTAVAPCRTLVNTLAKVAPGGSIFVLDSAEIGLGFSVNITNSVTIDGGAHGAVVTGDTSINPTVYVTGTGIEVTLRNLTIVGLQSNTIGAGLAGSTLELDHVTAAGSANGSDTIRVTADPTSLIQLSDVDVSGGPACVRVIESGVGAASLIADHLTARACGIGLAVSGNASVRYSTFRGGTHGIQLSALEASSSIVENSLFTGAVAAVHVDGPGTLRVSNCVISNNTTGVEALNGGTLISFRNNSFSGNGTDGAISLSTSLK